MTEMHGNVLGVKIYVNLRPGSGNNVSVKDGELYAPVRRPLCSLNARDGGGLARAGSRRCGVVDFAPFDRYNASL